LPAGKVALLHYRIDKENSNAYEVWKTMGSPKQPSAEQIAILRKSRTIAITYVSRMDNT
jgi:xylan 1,4-beta-xylosidase